MLVKNLGPVTMMGFARYSKKQGVDTAELIEAVRQWQRGFLCEQPGIAMHCFLGNAAGSFADAIMAVDSASFEEMARQHGSHPSAQRLMEMLDPDSIRLTPNLLLKDNVKVPTGFSCIEFGTFRPKIDAGFSQSQMLEVSARIESEYLADFEESQQHIMGRIDEDTYSEIAFVKTSGAAREICAGYVGNPACEALLQMFDPASVDLDFWHVLA